MTLMELLALSAWPLFALSGYWLWSLWRTYAQISHARKAALFCGFFATFVLAVILCFHLDRETPLTAFSSDLLIVLFGLGFFSCSPTH